VDLDANHSPSTADPGATVDTTSADRPEPLAADQLMPLIYDELRGLAAGWLRDEAPGHTLQATALVNEAYLRLLGRDPGREWEGRAHFFASAARAMRRILVEHARAKRRVKRGGGLARRPLELDLLVAPEDPETLLGLDEALGRLEAVDEQAAQVVQLRMFAGLTVKQAAEVLGVSRRTVDYSWAYARAWLLADLRGRPH
jgi:RNA polymerase sigma factor (TIGR02999 family)